MAEKVKGITASGGWVAPSKAIYDIAIDSTFEDELIEAMTVPIAAPDGSTTWSRYFPRITAARGGIRYTRVGPRWHMRSNDE